MYDSLTNFSSDPAAFPEQDYSEVDLVQQFSVLFSLPLTVDRVLHDTCHSQLLGTGKTTNGSPDNLNAFYFLFGGFRQP